MKRSFFLAGSTVALVTPYRDGRVDMDELRKLVDWHLAAGTDVLAPCGCTGESATMTHDEHEAVIEAVVRRVRGRRPVMAGTGSNNTIEAVRLTRFAARVGADAALVITPYYNKPTQEGLYQHYVHVARSADIPIVVYNVPGRTAVNVTPETLARLSRCRNIVAVKEASGSLDQVSAILQETDLEVLSGDDSLTLPMLAVGAAGVISVAANVVPAETAALVRAGLKGDFAAARRMHRRLFPLFKALFLETNPIPVKAALAMMGRIGGDLRLPLTAISAENAKRLRKVLVDLGLV
ncbi:MAG: 4-hydroxy-tetrahydrodipicolinate synthase [Planctomycetota bacterium]